jgi:uncharacterized membrane protein
MLAHIAGIPIEETAFGFGPVVFTIGGIASLRLRGRILRLRARRRTAAAWGPAAGGRP